eukprot:m.212540 g.212540  ORF g.212540 m.212540 type:complete len:310 (+) comp15504_c0_seq3:4019-4948(+)
MAVWSFVFSQYRALEFGSILCNERVQNVQPSFEGFFLCITDFRLDKTLNSSDLFGRKILAFCALLRNLLQNRCVHSGRFLIILRAECSCCFRCLSESLLSSLLSSCHGLRNLVECFKRSAEANPHTSILRDPRSQPIGCHVARVFERFATTLFKQKEDRKIVLVDIESLAQIVILLVTIILHSNFADEEVCFGHIFEELLVRVFFLTIRILFVDFDHNLASSIHDLIERERIKSDGSPCSGSGACHHRDNSRDNSQSKHCRPSKHSTNQDRQFVSSIPPRNQCPLTELKLRSIGQCSKGTWHFAGSALS